MKGKKLNIEDFQIEKLSTKQQKIVHGGDDPTGPIGDPVRGGGGGGGTT